MSIEDMVKLGKRPTTFDPRTIQYRDMASPWTPPPSYSFDAEHGDACPPRMYLNDTYGDCVIVAQANHQTRLELDEQGRVITISDAEVKAEYFRQTGGPDVGLYPLDSLKAWRNGWTMAGEVYRIHSFAQVTPQDKRQTAEACVVGRGLQVAVNLPLSAADQMNVGQAWELVSGPRSEAGSWGGHMMYLRGYDQTYVEFWTWKKVQRATWRWLAAYSDFCAIAVDDVNRRGVVERIDTDALTHALGHL